MGCFNKMGFISRLPITYEDDVVFFICGGFNQFAMDDTPIAPTKGIEPLFLPIIGKYNDYGAIESIVVDDNVKYIENLFGISIDRVIDAIQRNGGTSYKDINAKEKSCLDSIERMDNDYRLMLSKLIEHINFYSIKTDSLFLVTTIEHRSVYEKIKDTFDNSAVFAEYDKAVTALIDADILMSSNVFDVFHTTSEYRNALEALHTQITNGEDIDKVKAETFTQNALKEIQTHRALASFDVYNPFRETFLGMKGYNAFGFDWNTNSQSVKDMMAFIRSMGILCICFDTSVYGNQMIDDVYGEIKSLYEHFLQIIDKKIEKNLED